MTLTKILWVLYVFFGFMIATGFALMNPSPYGFFMSYGLTGLFWVIPPAIIHGIAEDDRRKGKR